MKNPLSCKAKVDGLDVAIRDLEKRVAELEHKIVANRTAMEILYRKLNGEPYA